jgi:hypothetical protein
MQFAINTAHKGALLALIASARAAPTTTISAAEDAGASSADVYPPAGSKFGWNCAESGVLMAWLRSRGQLSTLPARVCSRLPWT